MKKGESLVWFLFIFFNGGGGSSGFHRQALSSKRATSLAHQIQRKYSGLVLFALSTYCISQETKRKQRERQTQEKCWERHTRILQRGWLLASAGVHFMGHDALHACMGVSIRMDVKIVGNILYVHAWEAWMERARERERERESAPAWTLVVLYVYGQGDLGGFLTRMGYLFSVDER
ncbi:hypothetical protein IMY05_001G0240700 [Salix suchowensis]|nr:hypothetical protein IMY05_001G0240700 [Salix suchowensis]